ncbi:hypothetical protein ABPG75_010112 [Micractinium tetrahymenae]
MYVRTIGGPGSGRGQFNGPAGILALPDGTLFVADENNSRIQKLHENGAVLAIFGSGIQGSAPEQWTRPNDIALSPDGSKLFALDSGNQRVKVLGLDGTLKFTFGSLGHGNGRFLLPLGLATDPSGVYVTDYFDHRVQKFDFSGNFLWTTGSQGTDDGQGSDTVAQRPSVEPRFDSPIGCAVARNVRVGSTVVREVLYVADNFNSRVQYFNAASGSYLGQFFGDRYGDIAFPSHLDVTADGSIVVADSSLQRFQRLSTTGVPQFTVGSPGSGPGQFDDPSGVSVVTSPGLEAVYVADHSLKTIQKFSRAL